MDALAHPLTLLGVVAGSGGLFLLAQARLQGRLLRQRIAHGVGTAIVDPPTGLYAAPAAWQCIRAEANRASRLGRAMDVWIGTASSSEQLDKHGAELAFQLPRGATGVRLDARRVCVVTCVAADDVHDLASALHWRTLRVPVGPDAARNALAFLSEVDSDAA